MNPLHIFSGPSLSPTEVQLLAPHAIAHPPAQQGDFFKISFGAGDVILLIDGYYGSVPTIMHQEIIEFLEKGVRVYGCSSLGALRAVELAPVGMIGLGYVYEQFRNGFLIGDDEVAVVHDPIDFSLLTIPLVNIRYGITKLCSKGKINFESGQKMIDLIAELPFSERLPEAILDLLKKKAGDSYVNDIWGQVCHESHDIKKLDAKRATQILHSQLVEKGKMPETFFRKNLRNIYQKENISKGSQNGND